MPQPITNHRPDNPESWRSVSPGEKLDIELRSWCVASALSDYLRGDNEARQYIQSQLGVVSDAESSILFQRIQFTLEAFAPPFSVEQARAAVILAHDSRTYLPDRGARLFQVAASIAEGAQEIALARAAWLGRAHVCYEAENIALCREACKASLLLPRTKDFSDLADYCRAYTLIGKTFLAEGDEGKALRSAETLETVLTERAREVQRIVRRPQEASPQDFFSIVEAHLFVGDTLAKNQKFERGREWFQSTLERFNSSQTSIAEARVRCMDGYAALLREEAEWGPEPRGPLRKSAEGFAEAKQLLDDAEHLIEAAGADSMDELLLATVLHGRALALYGQGEIVEAKSDIEDALAIYRIQSLLGLECEYLIETATEVLDVCMCEIEGAESSEPGNDDSELEPPDSWKPENDPE